MIEMYKTKPSATKSSPLEKKKVDTSLDSVNSMRELVEAHALI